jgi:hypothetical protein
VRRRPDGLSRVAAGAMAAARAGIGAAALFAAGPALRSIGFEAESGSARALGRMAGARDLALAGLVAGGLGDRDRLRAATLAATAADAADAAIFIAAAREPSLRRASALSAPAALAAVYGGLWLARRLG